MRAKDDDANTVLGVDLLVPNVGELAGGSLREHRLDVLKARLAEEKMDSQLAWYLELREFGGAPTAGFGVGLERLIQYILKVPNIRDTIAFPRWPHNCLM